MRFQNSYEDSQRAKAYAQLEFAGTYYLAYRDLHNILNKFVRGNKALDFRCGTGRSTRFLRKLGFNVVGIDISENMINQAKKIDVNENYQHILDGSFGQFKDDTFDLVLSVFTFDNIPTRKQKKKNLQEIRSVLKTNGVFVNLVSSPEIYTHEWVSFLTKDFPENKKAKSGDVVKIIISEIPDERPVQDIVWSDIDYQDIFSEAGFEVVGSFKPLAKVSEKNMWINETKIAPWVIYVLNKNNSGKFLKKTR
ncbi:class I SAM-dependent methyltransferase [Candidatus Bathyarchaeota archaeon]|nr:class I SAM-dependent methyltransferase [Candidatus Bathyarchaeota archaeon]